MEGYLPLRVAFPSLASMVLGPDIEIPGGILLSSFVDSVSVVECGLLKSCLSITDTKFSTRITNTS